MGDDKYAVFGHPIKHSQSPRIHTLFAQQTHQLNMTYSAQDVPAEEFELSVKDFVSNGGRGLNCTVPLKELAYSMASELSARAMLAKAVNTLVVSDDGQLYGDNTDGIGLIQDLTLNLQLDLGGHDILLLGAGGASRGILGPLLDQSPNRLIIANRTVAKAETLAFEFNDCGALHARSLADLKGYTFDLIINATAASLSNELPDIPRDILNKHGCCYDLAYGCEPTAFVRWGLEYGASKSVDGLGMLVEQAAEAFALWRGVRPDTFEVIDLLNAERNAG